MKKTTRRPVRRLTESQLRSIIRQEVRRSQALRENLGMVGVREAEEAQSEVTAMAMDYIQGKQRTIDIRRLYDLLDTIESAGGINTKPDALELIPLANDLSRGDEDAERSFFDVVDDWLEKNGIRR
jgi:hypothetical protein